MTQMSEPDDFYPVALRKIFSEEIPGPLELSVEELEEARAWSRQLMLDVNEIDALLESSGL